MTNRLSAYIIDKLRNEVSFTSIAKEVNLSVSTVIRIFDFVSYAPKELPIALSIDEFKGNTNGEKYQCILTDPVNKIVLDILPMKYEHYLTQYFSSFDKADREKVMYFVSDMWKPYANISSVWFKNVTQIVDKYHWIRQIIWALPKAVTTKLKFLNAMPMVIVISSVLEIVFYISFLTKTQFIAKTSDSLFAIACSLCYSLFSVLPQLLA